VQDVLPDPKLELSADTVIVRSDGGKAVKGFGADGKTIRIDAKAKGADKLAIGKILLLTGVTVVRVANMTDDNGVLSITGAPVGLPELIPDGELSWSNRPIDLSSAQLLTWGSAASGSQTTTTIPGSEGYSEDQNDEIMGEINNIMGGGSGGAQTTTTEANSKEQGLGSSAPGPRLVSLEDSGTTTTEKPSAQKLAKGDLGDIEYQISYTPPGKQHLLTMELSMGGTVSGSLEAEVALDPMEDSGSAKVANGEVTFFDHKLSDFTGDMTVTGTFQALTNTASVKTDPLFNLPLTIEAPLLIAGIPFTVGVQVTLEVRLSMAEAENTLSGKAHFTFTGNGGLHYEKATLSVLGKQVQTIDDLLPAVQGAATGPVGVIYTSELPRVRFGLGYAKVNVGAFVSNGTAVTFLIQPMPAPCHATNVATVVAAGIDYKFLGAKGDVWRKAIGDYRQSYQVPNDGRCNSEPGK
jgi:hypothetical protein